MSTKDYQMFWDCGHCGTKELLGVSHRHCPNCGAAQDETKRYFPPEGKEVELEHHMYFGVDWDCPYCSTPNSKNSHNCVNCGGPQDGSLDIDLVDVPKKENKTPNRVEKDVASGRGNAEDDKVNSGRGGDEEITAYVSSGTNTNTSTSTSTSTESASTTRPRNEGSKTKKTNWLVALMLVVFLGLSALLVYGFMKVESHNVLVESKTWERSIEIEEYRQSSSSDWCSSMPSDAYNVSRYRQVRSHRDVADGQTCRTERSDRGDGSYRSERICHTNYRKEPVYDYKCSYTVNRWGFSNRVLASGNHTTEPHFPNVNHLKLSDVSVLGARRIGGRSENYKIGFSYLEDGKRELETCNYKQSRWGSFILRESYSGKVRMIGGLICGEVLEIPGVEYAANSSRKSIKH